MSNTGHWKRKKIKQSNEKRVKLKLFYYLGVGIGTICYLPESDIHNRRIAADWMYR
jgi:hypothetical protein